MTGPGLRLLAGMGLAGALVLGLSLWLHFDPDQHLPIGSIQITGEPRHADTDAILERVRAHAPGFVGTDLEVLREELQAMPWVDAVQLRRRWPDTLEVHVTEPVPVAQWGDDHLVDRHGRLFGPVDLAEWDFLPALAGEDGRQVVLMHRYLEVSARLADAGFEVVGVHEGKRHDWTIHLADGAEVLMGRDVNLNRLGQLVRAAPALRAREDAPIARVDLRYPHGLAVAWAEEADNDGGNAR
ncbi:cell division protein FtsQ [Thioalkalivibrio sp. K90mix]|uniref:Cell division protein FtsQ n=1 Tax=Thioalkalivibrio sp. (strain K90mix) TaxID=396595 RepID=FTSQ_THISK|nr:MULTISPECIES: cell division protein FtsQ/DivIB [unclassified Thioalkalivibrio]D3SD88.1 RecName: Full=Cell division protein FtsQ [Thioalkalivibrio sp. K90mix]ADC72687.1 cell division protein FtsQ [Thioalkalivibrio sp. K90mix]